LPAQTRRQHKYTTRLSVQISDDSFLAGFPLCVEPAADAADTD